MKIINWIFSSFFRTLGRFLFYIAIGLLAMLFISGKVNAAEMNPRYATVNGTYLWSDGRIQSGGKIEILVPSNSNTKLNLCISPDYYASNDSNVTNKYYYGYIETCTTGQYNLDGWWQSGGTGYGLLKGWLDTNEACSTNNYPGRKQKVYFQLVDFTTPSGGADFSWSCFQLAQDNVNTGYQIVTKITNIVLTDKDYYPDDKFKQEEINRENQSLNNQQTQINQNDTIINQNNATNDKLDSLNGNLTSTEGADLGALQNSAGWLPAGPVDSILNLPLSLLNNLTTNLNKSCQPVILPIPYVNKDLTLPCVNTLYDDMGISGWVTTIGVIASAFIMFSYLVKLYKWVDDTLSFRENNQIDNWGGI